MNAIEVRNLTKYYGKSRGIIDVSFDVREGEIFGFIGPNGAGKSTTIRALLSLIYPTSGEGRIFGRDCIKEGADIRKDIGYIPSEVYYYDNMKVIDLLRYSASFYENVEKGRMERLAEMMDLDLHKKIESLSYGNKKKVGIVQGLLHKPKLILLDEPTSGLDPLMQQRFFDLIREENRAGATVFFSSHILGEVQRMCSRVGIIKEGRMVRIVDIAEIQNSSYKTVKVETWDRTDLGFPDMEGVTNYSTDGDGMSFIFSGDINDIVSRLASGRIRNLIVEDPTLEDIFLHYYQKGE